MLAKLIPYSWCFIFNFIPETVTETPYSWCFIFNFIPETEIVTEDTDTTLRLQHPYLPHPYVPHEATLHNTYLLCDLRQNELFTAVLDSLV